MSTGFHTVHVRVNDAATGQPTPCRIRFTGPDGTYYAPFGRLAEFATGRGEAVGGNVLLGVKRFAYLDGSAEVRLPAGVIGVEIHKGPEYQPLLQELPVGLGKMALRFTLSRWSDLRRDRWYSGDARVHYLSPPAALLEGAAEDVAVVNVLAQEEAFHDSHGQRCTSIPNIVDFSGQQPALERPGHLVVVNTHNSHPFLGSLGLLNCHRPVYPLRFGGSDGRDDWSLADWCQQCHRKGGLVVWTKVDQGPPDFGHGETVADLILGDVDAFELDFFEDSPFDVLSDWYELLNCGVRVPLVGSSGKDGNGVALGRMRTYARLLPDELLTYKNWIEAVRAGRTFVTNGPLLEMTVDGCDPGTVLENLSPDQPVLVRASARSAVPFETLELVFNGAVIASASAAGEPTSATLEVEWSPTASGWLAARCRGSQQVPHRPAYQRVFAHTAPTYSRVQGRPQSIPAAAAERLLSHLSRMSDWALHQARCDSDRLRQHLVEIFQNARQTLEKRLNG